MFEHDNCMATLKCKNVPYNHVWCFRLNGESFDRPTWVQLCGFHLHKAGRIVTIKENPKAQKLHILREGKRKVSR